MDRPKLLIADDNHFNLSPLVEYFEEFYDVIIANSGQTAVALAQKEKPFAILMDVQMPQMTGLQATILLKSDPATKNIPIIIVTAFSYVGDEHTIREIGADHFIPKPVDLDEMHTLLEKYAHGILH